MNQLTAKTRVKEGGRIVIPAKFREVLGIEIGESVTLTVQENELRIKTSNEALKRLQKLVRKHVGPNRSVVDEFLKERREEALKDG